MTDDSELLRRYAADASQAAFTELVQRHVGLVFHAARRQLGGDAHRAQDVAQVVFATLARKAGALAGRPSLAGWLYTSTRYAAVQSIRAEARRAAREQEAQRLNAIDAPGVEGDWRRLEPFLDEALAALTEADREAVLLRYFESCPLADIGARLGLSPDAARMRIDRALERMRRLLGRRGVTSGAAALAAALEAHAAAGIPAGLAASVSAAALAMPAAAVTGAILMSTTKITLGVMGALLAVGAAGLAWQQQRIRHLRAAAAATSSLAVENARLQAENLRLQRQLAAAPPPLPRAAAANPAGPRAGSGRPTVPLAAGLVAVESLGNAGQATARAAFATQLWAARTGNIEVEAGTLLLSDDEKARLEALRPSLPPDIQSQYPTPEDLLAFALAGSPHPVGGMQVLGETQDDPDDVTLQTQWQHTDDAVVHTNAVQFHNDGGTWKLVVPPVIVRRAAAFLSP